jgi:hypothetical protein
VWVCVCGVCVGGRGREAGRQRKSREEKKNLVSGSFDPAAQECYMTLGRLLGARYVVKEKAAGKQISRIGTASGLQEETTRR